MKDNKYQIALDAYNEWIESLLLGSYLDWLKSKIAESEKPEQVKDADGNILNVGDRVEFARPYRMGAATIWTVTEIESSSVRLSGRSFYDSKKVRKIEKPEPATVPNDPFTLADINKADHVYMWFRNNTKRIEFADWLFQRYNALKEKPEPKRYRCIKACFDFTVGNVIEPNDSGIWPVDKLPEYFELIEPEPEYTMADMVNELKQWRSKAMSVGNYTLPPGSGESFYAILNKAKAQIERK